MTIQEQLEKINSTFEKLHSDFARFDSEKKSLDVKYVSIIESVQANYQKEKDRLIQEQDEVLKYYRIAKDNSKKELVHNGVKPQKPDLRRLNDMIERVNSYSRTDPMAGQIIDLCSSYNVYLEKMIKKADSKESVELQNVLKNKEDEEKNLIYRKRKVLSDCEEYIKSNDVKSLVSLFEMIHSDYEITQDYFRDWRVSVKRKKMMLLGFSQYYVDVPRKLCPTLKKSLRHHFDEITKMVNCPCGFTTDSHEEIFIEYTDFNEMQMKQGIQALILNFLRYFRPAEYKISVFDYIHYNADILGDLYVFASIKNGLIDPIPSDEKELKQSISSLVSYYKKVEAKIGSKSVYEYNRYHKPEERISYRILIINRVEETFRMLDESKMSYIINNAEKFGIITVRMTKSIDGGSQGKAHEKKYLAKATDYIRIISDAKGNFYIENDIEWMTFKWLTVPGRLPLDFVEKIEKAVRPVELGTKYFERYSPKMPTRSKGKRRPVSIPFAINEDDKVIECSFENELFAAYMMGASRSGKSTLLHTMISGLIMNYHPDELELWLLDFKMLEFKKYANHRPPHVKYLLLERSEDLVFDIIDQLEVTLTEREYIFSQHGWQKLADVPIDIYMPVIFVIIDEFAQMSQILKDTKGTGNSTDYTLKLTNLLQKGAAMGFKFIFASQTYTDGVEGLAEAARKQIQQRFALKNTYQEIKDTLELSSESISSALQSDMNALPPYETLFKWRTSDGHLRVDRLRNMYTENNEIEKLIDYIGKNMFATNNKSLIDSRAYVDKHPVLIDGGKPKTFKSQIPYYKKYETPDIVNELDEDDILVYPGVPCSFNLARPFTLINGNSENILIVGGNRENELSVVLSIFNSYCRKKYPIEVWANVRNSIYKRYKSTILCKFDILTDLEDICVSIDQIKKNVQKRKYENRLILILGYETIANDLELLGVDNDYADETEQIHIEAPEDISQVIERINACDDLEEKKRIQADYNTRVADYNARVAEYEAQNSNNKSAKNGIGIYDARDDLEWAAKRASFYGMHFVFCFEQVKDFLETKLDERAFRHKLVFAMSREDSLDIIGNRKANEIEEGVCLYTNGKNTFTMHPHLYYGVSCNGWQIDDSGNIVQRRA